MSQECNFLIFIFIYFIIYLVVPGLSCITRNLLVAVCELLVAMYGILFPNQGSNPVPLNWEPGVLATRTTREVPWNAFLFHACITRLGICYSHLDYCNTPPNLQLMLLLTLIPGSNVWQWSGIWCWTWNKSRFKFWPCHLLDA